MPGLSGRILVVDDNKVIRQLIRVNLELEGFEVVTAADGAECLDVVHRVRPDVVTLDVMMPRLGGLHTAARLRSDPRTWDIPIAIVSACTQCEVDNGESVGIDAFLAKPFEPMELVRTVGMLVREGRQQRERHDCEGRGGAPEGAGAAERGAAGGEGGRPRDDATGAGGAVPGDAAPGGGVESGGSAQSSP
ncbi:response regulator [Streptomyces noursei]|uniref:response regulator n=1 Tax=Streptomyces noursei TaxID=1971 RepID=UPI001F04A911|nr:response regulator [Streptomyces noursei]